MKTKADRAAKLAWIISKILQCRYIFERRVRDGKMSQEEADAEIALMTSIAEDYKTEGSDDVRS